LARAAQSHIEDLSQFRVSTAELLRDENLTLGGQQVLCYVIRATYEPGEHDPAPQKNPPEYTFWIEKDRHLVRKEKVVSRNSDSILQPLRDVEHTYTTSYTRIELGGTPPTELFTFTPPTTAKQVRRLFLNMQHIDLTGLPAPPLKLSTLDGKAFDPSSLEGHTVIVDFWASWCVPCIQEMQSLSKLAQVSKGSNLVVIGVNLYESAADGMEFIRKHHYGWTNLRGDSDTPTAWMLNGIPLVAVIGPDGNLAYYHNSYQQSEETLIVEKLREVDPKLKAIAMPCGNVVKPE